MRKILIISILLLAASVLLMTTVFSSGNLFKYNIIDPIPPSVKDLKITKDRGAMHGPYIYNFRADNGDAQRIIEKNKLRNIDYKDIESAVKYVIEGSFRGVDWWKVAEMKQMRCFGRYQATASGWDAMYLFVNEKGQVYIIDF